MTGNFFVFVNSERDQRDEADSEPGPARDAAGGPIAAVTTLRSNVFSTFELRRELCRSKSVQIS